MKILIIGNANSPFIIFFSAWIKKVRNNYKIDIFNTSSNCDVKDIYNTIYQVFPKDHFKKINFLTKFKSYYFIKKSITSIKKNDYDVILLHYVFPWYAILRNTLKRKTNKLIAVFWGSDLNRISKSKKKRLKQLLKKTDDIILGSPYLFEKINQEFPEFNTKFNMCYFGCEPIEEIKYLINKTTTTNYKNLLNINTNVTTIAIGYNGGRAQQHIKIIKNLKKSKTLSNFKKNIHFIFPVTYGLTDKYKSEIINELQNFKYQYTILTKYMTVKESAKLRLATDIFVNLQLTDSFNGTLRESFYAGNIIINGKWLPYQKIKEYGLYFNEIETINDFEKKLVYCIKNFEKEKEKAIKNQLPIYDITSWSKTIDSWLKVIEQ